MLTKKLKGLKCNLKSWNKEVFGRVEEGKKATLKTLAHWDNAETQHSLCLDEMEAKVKAIYDFKRWALMEEMSLRHKSREIWLKEGDKKHAFFIRW